ncbi:response regulator [candidate division WOR-3 bacterium]|nr:response regulator [candidate division WOR-3 bacterium]
MAKARILFVDDERTFADAMSQLLRINGYEVQAAYSGKLAMEIFQPGEFDLVITDLSMPTMDGIELVRQIRKLNSYQRIIVVTGFPSQRSQEQAYKLGTLNYIAKPFKPQRFLELVNDALRGQEEGLLGAIKLSPSDLVQLYSYMGKTIVLEILKGKNGEAGRIYFSKGQVVHAETEQLKGKEAFYEIQTWFSGIFKTEKPQPEFPHTIDEDVDVLLLEAARRQDEQPWPVVKREECEDNEDSG